MSEKRPSRARGLLARVSNRLATNEGVDPRVRGAGLRVIARAEQILDKLDGVADTMQKVADIELKVAERLVPIVDDLGQLVRMSLNEVRERRGMAPLEEDEPSPEEAAAPPVIIDHEPEG